MPRWLTALFEVEFGWRDALDIFLVAGLVYFALALLRRTRGAPIAVGILAFILLWRVVVALELQTLGTILDLAVGLMPLVVVIMFQNHIRRALIALGRAPLLRFLVRSEDERIVEAVSLAAMSLASQGHGGLMVFERAVGLRTWTITGVAVDARPSYELLMAIFHPRSPLHDGAVVISQGRLAAASCMLPLTTRPASAARYGSRHRAGIGLSEETDALVIVVSEERGTISLVQDGDLRVVEPGGLRDALLAALVVKPPEGSAAPAAA